MGPFDTVAVMCMYGTGVGAIDMSLGSKRPQCNLLRIFIRDPFVSP